MRSAVTLFIVLLPFGARATEQMLFPQSVAPIFELRCLSCHNEADREGGLSLESATSWQRGGDSGTLVDRDDPLASLLLARISGPDADMPRDGERLSEDEVRAIRIWLADGAHWPADLTLVDKSLANLDWWSLRPIARPKLPRLEQSELTSARTPVDLFVLARLHEHGLVLSPEADRRTLIRRLYFDLVGLPPSREEVQAFVQDDAPTAYEQLVERLLASPHYGERWGRHWLDVVKYADTCGYDKDKPRPNAWPYRDYVIRSLNEDKPYSRFVQEQVAGDALFPSQADGILGLGFIAAGPWDFIGHVEVPESKIDGRIARNIDRDEMVTNTFNTFCSATLQCARCHDHKFDPFTQEDYYSLQAIFAAVDRAERPYDVDPRTEAERRRLAQQLAGLRQRQSEMDSMIKESGGDELVELTRRITELQREASPKQKHPAFGYHSQIESSAVHEKWVEVDLGREVDIDQVVLHACHDEFAGIGAGFGFPPRFRLTASGNAQAGGGSSEDATVLWDQTASDVTNPGLAPFTIPVRGSGRARFVRLIATRLAERQEDYIFALAELEVLDARGNNVALNSHVTALDSIEAPRRWSRSNLTDGIWPQPKDIKAAEQLVRARADEASMLGRVNLPDVASTRERLRGEIQDTERALSDLPKGKMVYAAATQFEPQGSFKPTLGRPRPIHLLHRGDIQQPRAEMHPAVLPILGPPADRLDLPSDHSEADRRAALAKWLTRHDHPLTWRSLANRVWLYHFGRGLVDTPNDFGRMGQLPSHPRLLDWLAAEFRDGGGSIKDLQRLIVTSAVYRQASTASPDSQALRRDAENRLLWRMNRRRLEAEEVRDAVLAASGRLCLEMGGPGFYLFLLEKTDHSPHYEYHKFDPEDPSTHRRSVYRFIVRSQPDPFMTTLDCADSSQSTPQRNETVTALQALSLLNNRFNLVMARHFADRLRTERETLSQQVELGMQLTVNRRPTREERAELETYAREHGLANLCRLLFNLSEFVYLD